MTEQELISCHNHYMNSLVWMTAKRRAEYNLLKKEQEKINKERRATARARARGARGQSKGTGKSTDQENRVYGPGQHAQQLKKRGFNVFCFQASGSKQFLFALVRQPSFFKAKGLERLCYEWDTIKKSSEYKKAVEQSKERTLEQTKQKVELQKLRIKINRLRRHGEEAKELLYKLRDMENSYGRGKQQRPPGAYLATNEIFSKE